MLYPMKLTPGFTDALWGGTRLITEFGMVTDKKNAAEAWVLSCHPEGLSVVQNGEFADQTLQSVYTQNKGICGFSAEGYDKFPIIIKFIDAEKDLSVQVHPDDEYTAFIGEGEGKTEAWYILDCNDDAELILGFKREISEHEFLEAIENDTILDVVRKFKVKKGDVFYIEAGTLHAICKGVLLAEVQQNSDSTYRVYDYNRPGFDGNPRELHVERAIDVTKRVPYAFNSQAQRKAETIGSTVKTLLVNCEYFTFYTLEVNGEYSGAADESSFVSLLALDGSGEFECAGVALPIKKGESIFIPAGCGEFTLEGGLTILETRI